MWWSHHRRRLSMATARRIELTKETRVYLTTRPVPNTLQERLQRDNYYNYPHPMHRNGGEHLVQRRWSSYRRSTPPPPRCLSRARSTLACPISLSWHASLEELSHRLLSTMHCRGHCCSKW